MKMNLLLEVFLRKNVSFGISFPEKNYKHNNKVARKNVHTHRTSLIVSSLLFKTLYEIVSEGTVGLLGSDPLEFMHQKRQTLNKLKNMSMSVNADSLSFWCACTKRLPK